MTPESKQWIDNFLRQSSAWHWPEFLLQLGEADLLVIEDDLRQAFEDMYGALGCKLATPERALRAVNKDISRVFVLCRTGERALVKRLSVKFPKRRVISMTHDIAPRGLFSLPTRIDGFEEDVTPAEPPVILLSTPYSDAEYLAAIMQKNGLAEPWEYLDHTLALWLEEFEGFGAVRYMDTVVKLYRQNGAFDIHMQTDLLQAILKNSPASRRAFANWIKRTEATVIYFSRRDKFAQVCLAAAMEASNFRSVWQMNPEQREAFSPVCASSDDVRELLTRCLAQEAMLEDFLRDLVPDFRSVTLEELVETPVEVMKALAIFLGKSRKTPFEFPDYAEAYRGFGPLWAQAADTRRALISELGLMPNAAGSWVTETDQIFAELG